MPPPPVPGSPPAGSARVPTPPPPAIPPGTPATGSAAVGPAAPLDAVGGPRPVGAPSGTAASPTGVSPSAPTGAATPASPTVNPLEILQRIGSGEFDVTMPGIEGDYGSGMTGFHVNAGTVVRLHGVVRNGELVPGTTRVTFSPPLGAAAWATVDGFLLDDNGHINATVGIGGGANISLDLTNSLLGIPTLPRNLNNLYTLLLERSAAMASQASSFLGTPFDFTQYQMHINNATLNPGTLPIPGADITLGAGTRISVVGGARGLTLDGAFRINRFDNATPDGTHIDARSISADGRIQLDMDAAGAPTRVRANLTNVTGRLLPSTVARGESRINIGAVALPAPGGTLGVDVALGGAAPRMDVSANFANVTARLTSSRLVVDVPNNGAPTGSPATRPVTVTLNDGEFTGSVGVTPTGVTVDARSLSLSASADHLSFGSGTTTVGLDYANATVSGDGSVSYANGIMNFTRTEGGAGLTLHGSIEDGRLGQPGAPFFADFAPGTEVSLTVNQARFGGGVGTFAGSGEFDVRLDGGTIRTVGKGAVTLTRGTTAHITASEIAMTETGPRVRADMTITSRPEATIDPASVAVPGATVTSISPITGTADAQITGIELDPDGSFRIDTAHTTADLRLSRATGRFTVATATPTGIAASTTVAPVIDVLPGTLPTVPTLSPPSTSTALGMVNTASIDLEMPLPFYTQDLPVPGGIGSILGRLGGNGGTTPTMRYPSLPTRVSAHMAVTNGAIDFSQSTVAFTPPLPAIGPSVFTGVTINADGHIIANFSLGLTIDLTTRALNGVTAPRTVGDIPTFIDNLTNAANVQAMMPAGAANATSANPIERLAALGASISITGARLNTTTLPLSARSSITVGSDTNFDFAFVNGGMRLRAHATVSDGNFHEPGASYASAGTHVTGLAASADIEMTYARDGAVAVGLSNVRGSVGTAFMRRNASDVASLRDLSLVGGSFNLRIPASGATTFSGSMAGEGSIAPSTVGVTVDGRAASLGLNSGHFDGSIDFSPGVISGTARITNLSAVTSAVPLSMRSATMDVSSATLTASDVMVNFSAGGAAGNSFNLAASPAPAAAPGAPARATGFDVGVNLSGGSIGRDESAFFARFGSGTRATMHVNRLAFGAGASGLNGLTLNASAVVNVNLNGGHIILQDGQGNPIRLDISPGTGGRIDFGRIETAPGQPFVLMRGALDFTARATGAIPEGGIDLGNGARLTAITTATGEVRVHIDGFSVEHNGTFAIGGVHLTADLTARGATGTLPPFRIPGATAAATPTRTPARTVRPR